MSRSSSHMMFSGSSARQADGRGDGHRGAVQRQPGFVPQDLLHRLDAGDDVLEALLGQGAVPAETAGARALRIAVEEVGDAPGIGLWKPMPCLMMVKPSGRPSSSPCSRHSRRASSRTSGSALRRCRRARGPRSCRRAACTRGPGGLAGDVPQRHLDGAHAAAPGFEAAPARMRSITAPRR